MRIILATRVPNDLASRAESVARKTGLDKSDLLRVGLMRVVEEFEKSGSLRVGKTKKRTSK